MEQDGINDRLQWLIDYIKKNIWYSIKSNDYNNLI